MNDRLTPAEPLLALAVRTPHSDRDHPAGVDLELLFAGGPGVAAVAAEADLRVWIVFSAAPPDVRAAARRLHAGPLPAGICRVPLH